MATFVDVQISGLSKVVKNLERYPEIAGDRYSRAINATLFLIQKYGNEGDYGNGGIFQFKTPRALRTGKLSLSFLEGTHLANPYNLVGIIGPTVRYAIIVHEGLGRMKGPNRFMERIVKKAQPDINRIFAEATDQVAEALATA